VRLLSESIRVLRSLNVGRLKSNVLRRCCWSLWLCCVYSEYSRRGCCGSKLLAWSVLLYGLATQSNTAAQPITAPDCPQCCRWCGSSALVILGRSWRAAGEFKRCEACANLDAGLEYFGRSKLVACAGAWRRRCCWSLILACVLPKYLRRCCRGSKCMAFSHRLINKVKLTSTPHNQSLHPTAYSFVRSSLRFQRRVSSSVVFPCACFHEVWELQSLILGCVSSKYLRRCCESLRLIGIH
jgi:hypothetical protein